MPRSGGNWHVGTPTHRDVASPHLTAQTDLVDRHALRSLRLLVLCLSAGVLGAGLAWLIHPGQRGDNPLSGPGRFSLPGLPPQPPPAPPRDHLAQLQQNQVLPLPRPDGSTINVGYTSVIVDPRWTTFEFFGGWNREQQANVDQDALLFTSGPTFARGHGNGALAMKLHGDLLMANGRWPAGNRAAAAARAWVGISKEGELEFGYGDLTPDLEQRLRVFIGGLHAFTNTLQDAPTSYRGVYGEMKLADVRIIYGLRPDGRLELVETADGVLFRDLETFVAEKGFLAAYLPDHASKSRLIVPGRRPWTEEHAVWVSGGKPSITQMPFLLKIKPNQDWLAQQPDDVQPVAGTN